MLSNPADLRGISGNDQDNDPQQVGKESGPYIHGYVGTWALFPIRLQDYDGRWLLRGVSIIRNRESDQSRCYPVCLSS